NRTRLAREIITAIRSEVPGLVVVSRLNVFDGIPFRKGIDGLGEPCKLAEAYDAAWGTDLSDAQTPDLFEPLRWIGDMEALGVASVLATPASPSPTSCASSRTTASWTANVCAVPSATAPR